PRRAHFERTELLRDVERGRFSFDVRIRGDDHFAHAAAANALDQAGDVDVLRTDAAQRRERAEENVKDAFEVARLFDRGDVERFLDDADDGRIAPRVAADRARLDIRHVVADR